ncbi:hypothetical protein [Kosakonia cowanii]|uniref:hypothetical protein n=1 Tax=Kosakonia cowanii TaxID=208223 RepID=UPI003D97A85D
MKKRALLNFLLFAKVRVYLNKKQKIKSTLTSKIVVYLLTKGLSQEEKEYRRMKRLVAELDLDAKVKDE